MAEPAQAPCGHLNPGSWPLTLSLILDDHLGMTDAVARCRICGRSYLLEMLDWAEGGRLRLLRLATLDSAHADALLRDLARGSCDAGRAAAEIEHVTGSARRLPWLLLVDTSGPAVTGLVPAPADRPLPSARWRELPCDGSWVAYARSYVEMEKP